MKTINYITFFVLLILLASCATTVKFPVSTLAPAADGSVTITKDQNNNYVINMKVKYLASPDRLVPARKCYVVWLLTNSGTNINLGMLIGDKNNNASFKSVNSSKPIQIFVTAEDAGDLSFPGNQELFRTETLKLK
ncbi:MAG: hypothetical protein Q8904_06325 [Bacteroidota bacterium]|nr:hypothetical protein [Bacteroidota bacterium]